jgi:hypothetical protein
MNLAVEVPRQRTTTPILVVSILLAILFVSGTGRLSRQMDWADGVAAAAEFFLGRSHDVTLRPVTVAPG